MDAYMLAPGDQFLGHFGQVPVTVLREREATSDRFGQDLFRFWCRRDDTGEEGFCTFGHGAEVAALREPREG